MRACTLSERQRRALNHAMDRVVDRWFGNDRYEWYNAKQTESRLSCHISLMPKERSTLPCFHFKSRGIL